MSLASISLILGVISYVFGIPMITGHRRHLTWRKKFLSDENTIRFLSIVTLSLTAVTLKRQWEVTPDGEGLIVFLVWLGLLEGALMALVPGWYVRVKNQMATALISSPTAETFWGMIFILLGAFFTYMGVVLA